MFQLQIKIYRFVAQCQLPQKTTFQFSVFQKGNNHSYRKALTQEVQGARQ